MFSGSHLVSFDVTMPRLWTPDYFPNGRGRIVLRDAILDEITNGKQYVIIQYPFNINLNENQGEILLNALIQRGFVIEHVLTSAYGQTQMQYIMKKV